MLIEIKKINYNFPNLWLKCLSLYLFFHASNPANLEFSLSIFLTVEIGRTEWAASSDVNILSKLETSSRSLESLGLNSGTICLAWRELISISLNQG